MNTRTSIVALTAFAADAPGLQGAGKLGHVHHKLQRTGNGGFRATGFAVQAGNLRVVRESTGPRQTG